MTKEIALSKIQNKNQTSTKKTETRNDHNDSQDVPHQTGRGKESWSKKIFNISAGLLLNLWE